jgi:hypothetical protein
MCFDLRPLPHLHQAALHHLHQTSLHLILQIKFGAEAIQDQWRLTKLRRAWPWQLQVRRQPRQCAYGINIVRTRTNSTTNCHSAEGRRCRRPTLSMRQPGIGCLMLCAA